MDTERTTLADDEIVALDTEDDLPTGDADADDVDGDTTDDSDGDDGGDADTDDA
jgi:hypothetical protein